MDMDHTRVLRISERRWFREISVRTSASITTKRSRSIHANRRMPSMFFNQLEISYLLYCIIPIMLHKTITDHKTFDAWTILPL